MAPVFQQVGIVGAGAMGRGIAQLATQAGSLVVMFDMQSGAAESAQISVFSQWDRLCEKGKLNATEVAFLKSRLRCAVSLNDFASCDLVIEAVVERLDVKTRLMSELEAIVQPRTVLASNTSSLSVTAIATALGRPEQVAGFHFFNPAPLMKVVEVIAGLRTDPSVCAALVEYARQMGHTPVKAADTPGFIVNHAGRAYGTEALRIVNEGVTDYATIDRILKDQIGFKLGPFELMDLTGLDVSHPVMDAIYHQYFEEPRYRPSIITAQRLVGGLLGKKSGAGFYDYVNGIAQINAEPPAPQVEVIPPVWVSPRAARRMELLTLIRDLGATIETGASPSPNALTLVAPLGFDITTVAVVERLDPARTIGIDMLVDDVSSKRRVLATNPATRQDMRQAAHALMARDGKSVSVIKDSGGFVSQRVVAGIVNIGSDMCQQGICTPEDLESAVTLGLGYPRGPLALGNAYGPTNILEILFNMQTVYGDPRYRPSPWLRRRGAIGLSLLHRED